MVNRAFSRVVRYMRGKRREGTVLRERRDHIVKDMRWRSHTNTRGRSHDRTWHNHNEIIIILLGLVIVITFVGRTEFQASSWRHLRSTGSTSTRLSWTWFGPGSTTRFVYEVRFCVLWLPSTFNNHWLCFVTSFKFVASTQRTREEEVKEKEPSREQKSSWSIWWTGTRSRMVTVQWGIEGQRHRWMCRLWIMQTCAFLWHIVSQNYWPNHHRTLGHCGLLQI